MNVSLTPELEEFVSAKVQSGRYNSASEVVREALRLLEEHDSARAAQLAEFNAELGRRLAALDRGDVDFDLDEIWEYIAADNIEAADRWIGKLFDAFEALGLTPGMGHKREDLTPYAVLFWPVGAYLIIYRADCWPIEIVAVT